MSSFFPSTRFWVVFAAFVAVISVSSYVAYQNQVQADVTSQTSASKVTDATTTAFIKVQTEDGAAVAGATVKVDDTATGATDSAGVTLIARSALKESATYTVLDSAKKEFTPRKVSQSTTRGTLVVTLIVSNEIQSAAPAEATPTSIAPTIY